MLAARLPVGDPACLRGPATARTTNTSNAPDRRVPRRDGGSRRTKGFLIVAAVLLLGFAVPVQALGGLANIIVSATSQRAGEVESWTITFDSPTAGDAYGNKLVWTLPTGFSFQSPACTLEGPASVALSANGQSLTCEITNHPNFAVGEDMTWRFDGVQSPDHAQTTPAFVVDYKNAAGVSLGDDDEQTATILYNFLQSVSASVADRRTGIVTTLTFAFTTKNPVLGDLRFVLPSGFELQSDASCSIPGLSGLTLTRVSATEGVCELNGASLSAATAYNLQVSNVKNALYAQSYQAPTLETRTVAGALHDVALNVAFSLDAREFAETPLARSGSNESGATTWWEFEMVLSNPLPADDYVSITFPSGFDFHAGGTTELNVVSGASGDFEAATIQGQRVYAKLSNGESLPQGTRFIVQVTNVENPIIFDSPDDPGESEEVKFLLGLVNQALGFVGNIKDEVTSLLDPCDPYNEDCCETDPDDCDDPCEDPTNDSPQCCEANNNCPPPPTCDPQQVCISLSPSPTVTVSPNPTDPGPGGDGGDEGSGGSPPRTSVTKILQFLGSGSASANGVLLVAFSIVLVAGLGVGGYVIHQRRTQTHGVKRVPTRPPMSAGRFVSVLSRFRKP